MTRQHPLTGDPQQMRGGNQLDLFDEPEPGSGAAAGTTVVCLKDRCDDPTIADVVYVGRRVVQGGWDLPQHPLANPFRIGWDGCAEQVVAAYERWLDENPELVAEHLPLLRGRRLGCWCRPGAPCHARVLATRADALGGPS